MIVIVHTVVIIISANMTAARAVMKCGVCGQWSQYLVFVVTPFFRDFTSLSCVNSGNNFSRISISWLLMMDIFSGTYR